MESTRTKIGRANSQERQARRAIKKYGTDTCKRAFSMWESGTPPLIVAERMGLTTRQAYAAIDAGEYLAFEQVLAC